MSFFYNSEPCQEARVAVAQRAEAEAVRVVVGLHAAILEAVRGQVVAAVEARRPSTNTDSTSETSVRY